MSNRFARILLLALTILIIQLQSLRAQTLSGVAYDQDNIPIPFVNILVKNEGSGTSTDKDGQLFLIPNSGY